MSADTLRDKLAKLLRKMGTPFPHEREATHGRIDALLKRHKKDWPDVPDLLRSARDDDDKPAAATAPSTPAPLDLICRLAEKYLYLTAAQRVALTLWIAHTYMFSRFSVTPRLALLSPVSHCGKSTVLNLIDVLGYNTEKFDSATPAALFRLTDEERKCVLLDEVDNADLLSNGVLRSVINSGWQCKGKVVRFIDKEKKKFATFAPLALVAIGKFSGPLMSRCITIQMVRTPRTVVLERFDPEKILEQQRMCETVRQLTLAWAQHCRFEPDPPIPPEIRDRAADNWRVLIAIADATSAEWAKAAREAAVELHHGRDEDLAVQLLGDIRDVFNGWPNLDRIGSEALVTALIELAEERWGEWRGLRGDRAPRQLSTTGLAQILSLFDIRSRTIWPPRRGAATKSTKGYVKVQFQHAWESFCPEDGTPAQSNSIKRLFNP
jgi:Protein of unknown function (DUF3631)